MAYYWYQSDPQLYQMEVAAMKKFSHHLLSINYKTVLVGCIGEERFSPQVRAE